MLWRRLWDGIPSSAYATWRELRNQSIIKEVKAYLTSMREVMPKLEMYYAGTVPGIPLPDIEDAPGCLVELERVERWGFPNAGTWADQPADYIQDIESARVGREAHKFISRAKSNITAAVDQVFANAPAPNSFAGING